MSDFETDRDMNFFAERLQYGTLEPRRELADPGWIRVQVGVDVGQTVDPSAIAVAEWERREDGQHHVIRKLERLPLGMSYPAQADRKCERLENLRRLSLEHRAAGEPGYDLLTVIDVTGVGRTVLDLLHERGEADVHAVTLTATDRLQRRDGNEWSCGKSVLVSNLLVAIQSGRVHLPEGTDADALVSELSSFRLETTASGNITFNAKSGTHDDLIVALGLSTLPGLGPDQSGQSWLDMRIAPGKGW